MRERWAEENPQALTAALRALLRAAKFCDAPENASYIAALLSRRRYFALDSHAILASLPGGAMGDSACVFYRGAATFPWRSHGLWFLNEMRRWGLIDPTVDLHDLATRVYRPDLYRAAAQTMGVPAPIADWKDEGAHDRSWTLDATPESIAMPADRFLRRRHFRACESGRNGRPDGQECVAQVLIHIVQHLSVLLRGKRHSRLGFLPFRSAMALAHLLRIIPTSARAFCRRQQTI